MAGNVVDIKKIHDDMMRAVANDTKRMSEGAFKELFLSLFLDGTPSHGMTVLHWIDRAGGPFWPVHIVDNANPNTILFTVPPVSNREALKELGAVDANGRPLANIGHVIDIYRKLALSGPGAGDNYFDAEMQKRYDLMKNTPDFQENIRAWREIFARYGKGDLLDTKQVLEQKKQREDTVHDTIEDF